MTVTTLTPAPTDRIISDSTKRKYDSIINLFRLAVLESKSGDAYIDNVMTDASPKEMVDYLFNERARFRPNTFRMYRTALVWWFATLDVTHETQSAWARLHEPLPLRGYKDEKGNHGQTTLHSRRSSRKRTVSQAKLGKLLAELTNRTENARTYVERQRASELRYWLLAGLSTGLRPIEWSQAHWRDKEKGKLNVLTAKRKQGNYPLPSIAHLSDDEYMPMRVVTVTNREAVFWIDMHMRSVQAFLQSEGDNKTFNRYYDNNRLYLRTVCQKLFPNDDSVTLYMLRGQFAANRKISGQPREELAQEMGCSKHYTSAAYGKQVHGYKSLRGSYHTDSNIDDHQEGQVYPSPIIHGE